MKKWKIIFALLVVSCNGRSGHNPVLYEANRVHLEAADLYKQAHQLYDSLKKEAKASGDNLLLNRLDSIHNVMHDWEKGLYEVPGYEHKHSHEDHDHKHEHKTAPQMTAESMLEYQNNTRQAISEIKTALEGFAAGR